MELLARDQDVVCAPGVLWIDAERVVGSDEHGIGGAQYAVPPGKTIAPGPLLAHGLDHRRLFRYRDELGPYKQTRRQHRGDPHRGHDGEPPLELFILG